MAGAELLQNPCTMHLHGPWTDTELAAGLLVRGSAGDLDQHVAFARGELVVPRETFRNRHRVAPAGATTLPGCDRFRHAGDHGLCVERLLDEVERAVTDRLDRHRDVALA